MSKDITDNISNENEKDSSSASKIDAIKELIFGENIQTYNSEFEQVKKNLAETKEELENLIDSVKTELNQTIDSLNTDLNIRITDLENALTDKIESLDESKLDKKQLGKLLISLGDKISQ